MSHRVPGVPLIPQTQAMGCWYACLEMMVRWHRSHYGWSPGEPAIDAPQYERWSQLPRRPRGSGLGMAQARDPRDLLGVRSHMADAVRTVGLSPVAGPALADPTPAQVERWLQCLGPIMVNGRWIPLNGGNTGYRHVVVLVGIEDAPVSPGVSTQNRNWLIVHNPEPVNVGSVEQRPFAWLAQTLTPRVPVSLAYYRLPTGRCATEPLPARR